MEREKDMWGGVRGERERKRELMWNGKILAKVFAAQHKAIIGSPNQVNRPKRGCYSLSELLYVIVKELANK